MQSQRNNMPQPGPVCVPTSGSCASELQRAIACRLELSAPEERLGLAALGEPSPCASHILDELKIDIELIEISDDEPVSQRLRIQPVHLDVEASESFRKRPCLFLRPGDVARAADLEQRHLEVHQRLSELRRITRRSEQRLRAAAGVGLLATLHAEVVVPRAEEQRFALQWAIPQQLGHGQHLAHEGVGLFEVARHAQVPRPRAEEATAVGTRVRAEGAQTALGGGNAQERLSGPGIAVGKFLTERDDRARDRRRHRRVAALSPNPGWPPSNVPDHGGRGRVSTDSVMRVGESLSCTSENARSI